MFFVIFPRFSKNFFKFSESVTLNKLAGAAGSLLREALELPMVKTVPANYGCRSWIIASIDDSAMCILCEAVSSVNMVIYIRPWASFMPTLQVDGYCVRKGAGLGFTNGESYSEQEVAVWPLRFQLAKGPPA